MGIGGAFFVYTGVSLTQTLYGLYVIPDNRGLSLVMIENQQKNEKH